MVGKIPNAFIHNLLACTDLVQIIDSRLTLKKYGKYYRTCCPFHNDHTPSFIVNKKRQFFYCFGCGKHGNAIDFIMNFDGLNFVETIQELANTYGIKIEYEKNNSFQIEWSSRQKLYVLMKEVMRLYQNCLWQKSSANFALKYLIQRGIHRGIIEEYSLGYAPPNGHIINHLGRNYFNYLIDVGIIVNKYQKTYHDFFRERIIFPIRDQYGRVLGFGGRSLNHTNPKYLNSPHSILFNKGRQLYGLYELCKKGLKNSFILVVEGYMDVIALAQSEIYAVALLGTSTTRDQIEYLFRMNEHIIYCYDGDYAGRKAAWRALEIALDYMFDGRNLSFIFLPDGEDPESLIRKEGRTLFEQRIKNAESFYNFMFHTLSKKIDLSCIEGKAKFSSMALPLINKIPGEILRLSLHQILGEKVGIFDQARLTSLVNKPRNTFKPKLKLTYTPMRILITLLLQNPTLASVVPQVDCLNSIKLAGLSVFINLVKICINYPKITTGQLLEFYRNTKIRKYLQMLAVWNHMIIDTEVENTFKDTLTSIYNLALKQRQDKLIAIERSKGLNIDARRELWALNKALAKK